MPYIGDCIGEYYRVTKVDTRSLDSKQPQALQTRNLEESQGLNPEEPQSVSTTRPKGLSSLQTPSLNPEKKTPNTKLRRTPPDPTLQRDPGPATWAIYLVKAPISKSCKPYFLGEWGRKGDFNNKAETIFPVQF